MELSHARAIRFRPISQRSHPRVQPAAIVKTLLGQLERRVLIQSINCREAVN